MTPADIPTAPNWSFRADEAARSVTRLFGQRLLFLPGTHIAAIVRPSGGLKNLARPWHYWWQAHYVDCLVDTGRRELGTDGRPGTRFDGEDRPSAGRLASRLVTGHPAPQLPHGRQQLLRRHGLAGAVHAAAGEPRRGQPQDGRAPPQRQGAEEPHAAVRFRLHGRPRAAAPSGARSGISRTPRPRHRWRSTTPAPARRPGRRRCWTGSTPGFSTPNRACTGRPPDRPRRRGGAGKRHLHLQPGPGPGRAAGARRRGQPGPRSHARGVGGTQPHPPRTPRWGAAPRCCAAREPATAACSPASSSGTWPSPPSTGGSPPRPGRRPRRSSTTPPRPSGRAAASWLPGTRSPGKGGRILFSIRPELPARRHLPGGRRRRTFHPAAGVDGPGSAAASIAVRRQSGSAELSHAIVS